MTKKEYKIISDKILEVSNKIAEVNESICKSFDKFIESIKTPIQTYPEAFISAKEEEIHEN